MSDKYSYAGKNAFNTKGTPPIIEIGVVKTAGQIIPVNNGDKSQYEKDLRYNADPNMIRCRVAGSDWDDSIQDDAYLANCFPLLPAHLNVVPKVGEAVWIFTFSEETKFSDRLYMGPIISSPLYLNKDTIETTALAGLSISSVEANENIATIVDAQGVFPNYKDVALQGRDNSDIIFKDNEAIIRAGQHELNNNKKFNQKDPSYIQLKFNASLKKGENGKKDDVGSVINVVASKINLLTHKDGAPRFILNDREKNISDEELMKILKEAHPIPFGDTLLEYLKKLELAFMNHVHRFPGLKPSAVQGESYLSEYLSYPVNTILSKNIKIN